jgi:protein Tob/BTG
VSFSCPPRYGEKNNAFIVASFENEDENKDEISKKVSRALDKVTSDYHSGSSSSDEDTSKEVDVKPSSVAATPSPVYQVRPATACHCACADHRRAALPSASFSSQSQLHCPRWWNIFRLSSSCYTHTSGKLLIRDATGHSGSFYQKCTLLQ